MLRYKTLNNHFDISSFVQEANIKNYKIINFVEHRKELLVFYHDDKTKEKITEADKAWIDKIKKERKSKNVKTNN